MAYLASEFVIKHIVFIISLKDQKEATAIERLVKRRSQFRGFYRLQLEHHASSALPDLASMRSMFDKIFDAIVKDLRKSEPPNSTEDKTDDKENATDESPPLFNTFKSISAQNSFCELSQKSLKFLLFQALIEVLLRMPYSQSSFDHMWNLCHDDCKTDPIEAMKIRKFAEKYKSDKAVYYYTLNSCFFRLVNRAFRLEDVERIFRFGCYIADLNQQLEQLSTEQRSNRSQNTKTFHRGKRFSAGVVQQFKDNIGHLITMNGLLSTTECFNTSTIFAGIEQNQEGYKSVIFEININSTTTDLVRPYANIEKVSANKDENEVLFFMGFVWKIKSMEEMRTNTWYVVLQSCADYDSELITYIEQSRRDCTYLTLGNILRELGDYANAKIFYQRMLKAKNLPDDTRGHVYFNMGQLANDQGAYVEALEHFLEAETLIKPTVTENSEVLAPLRCLFAHNIVPSRLRILNNLGQVYLKDGEYQSAQDAFEAALRESGSDIERATVLNNYGLFEFQRRDIEKARDYLDKAVQLAQNDTCSSEFRHNLDAVLKHIAKKDEAASAARKIK